MKPFTKIAAFIFTIVALGHLIRLVKGTRVMLGSHDIPMWVSIFGLIVAGILAWGLMREGKR